MVGYSGPTLLIFEAFDRISGKDRIVGAFASQPWKKQPNNATTFYGDADSFLFQIKPSFQVWRVKHTGTSNSPGRRPAVPNYQYFNFDNRPGGSTRRTVVSGKPNDSAERKPAEGLGLGGTKGRPRFFISASLDKCYLGSNDATFEGDDHNNSAGNNEAMPPSSLLLEPLWDLQALEIWGVGGTAALQALNRHQSREDARVQQARQIDKSAFLNDFRSGLIESKMFDFHQEMRDRDGGCLLDCHDEGDDDDDGSGGRWQIGKP